MENIEWVVHPLWDFSQKKTIALICIYLAVVFGMRFAFEAWEYSVITAVLLFIALTKYFLPTKYFFTSENIVITFCGLKQVKRWGYYKSYFVCETGVFLSPFIKKSRLESFQGNYILFGKDNRDKVIEFVKAKIKTEQ